MKLTNTWKHALVGIAMALVVAGIQYLVNLIPNTRFEIGWFAIAVFAFLAIRYEVWQENNSPLSTHEYLKLKWLDCVVDVLAAVVCCAAVLWAFGYL